LLLRPLRSPPAAWKALFPPFPQPPHLAHSCTHILGDLCCSLASLMTFAALYLLQRPRTCQLLPLFNSSPPALWTLDQLVSMMQSAWFCSGKQILVLYHINQSHLCPLVCFPAHNPLLCSIKPSFPSLSSLRPSPPASSAPPSSAAPPAQMAPLLDARDLEHPRWSLWRGRFCSVCMDYKVFVYTKYIAFRIYELSCVSYI